MNVNSLPKKLCNNLLNKISRTMDLMEDAPEIQMSQNQIIDENFIGELFEHGLNNAKRPATHIFLGKIALIGRHHVFAKCQNTH